MQDCVYVIDMPVMLFLMEPIALQEYDISCVVRYDVRGRAPKPRQLHCCCAGSPHAFLSVSSWTSSPIRREHKEYYREHKKHFKNVTCHYFKYFYRFASSSLSFLVGKIQALSLSNQTAAMKAADYNT